jgi:hypothetical protein
MKTQKQYEWRIKDDQWLTLNLDKLTNLNFKNCYSNFLLSNYIELHIIMEIFQSLSS